MVDPSSGTNPVYGFRVKQTLDEPEVWYEVNAFAGKGMLCDGLITVIAALVLAAVPGISVDRYAMSVATLVFLALGITVFASFRHLRRVSSRETPATTRRGLLGGLLAFSPARSATEDVPAENTLRIG